MTAAEIKQGANLSGKLVSDAGAMKDSDRLGGGSEGALRLRLVVGMFDRLSDDCKRQLQDLGALTEFEGQPCIQVGKGTNSHCAGGGFGSGDDTMEFMLTGDGHVLAKKYHYFGYMESNGDWGASWEWQIAAGTYTIVDTAECIIEVVWQTYATKTRREDKDDAYDQNEDARSVEKPWEARLVEKCYQPYTIMPCEGNKTMVLQAAQKMMGTPDPNDPSRHYHDPKKNFKGTSMPGLNKDVIISLDMDPDHIPYWKLGSS